MDISCLVKEKNSHKVFIIKSMSGDRDGPLISLVEVNPDNTSEYLYPEKSPLIVNIVEFDAFYEPFE